MRERKARRLLSLLLAAVMLLSLLPATALAAGRGKNDRNDRYHHEIVEDETVPGEDETVPGEDETVPGEDETVPGDDETVPGEDETVPGEDETVPGDDEAALAEDEENGIAPLAVTVETRPADGETSGEPFASGTGGSTYFRIPALVTLSDGTLVAAADARWNHTSDGYGLDTIVSRSSDYGANWSYTFANYLGDNGNTYNTSSTAFIDPALAVDENDVIYMLVDLYPTGGYISSISSGTGFDSQGRLLLRASSSSSYDYYLENGKIYSNNGTEVSGYTVDEYFNITGNGYDTNLFFSDSPYRVLVTSYLYLTTSEDGGETWSAPMMLNPQVKAESEYFYGVGPGGGIVTSNRRIIFPCYTYTTRDGNTSVIYSDDGGATWHRSADMNVQTSEASISEVTVNGQNYLYMFTRHGGYFVSEDDGATWSSQKSVSGISYNTSCELSTLTYSETIDGYPAILLSAPGSTSSRSNGRIFVGLVQDDGTINWAYTYTVNSGTYAYSDLAELSDGSIGLLYEDASGSITYENIAMFDIAVGAEIGGTDENTNSCYDDTTGVEVNFGTNDVGSMTVVEATVAALEGKTYVAYNITPGNNYTGPAEVTIPLTKELQAASKLTGFVVETDGTVAEIDGGTRNADDTYTFTTPHFSPMGVLALDDEPTIENVIVYVGESKIYTDRTGNYGTDTVLDDGTATVTTEGTTVAGGTTAALGSMVSMNSNGTYTGVISDGNGNYLVYTTNERSSSSGTYEVTTTADINEATVWTVTRSTSNNNTQYTISYDGKVLTRNTNGVVYTSDSSSAIWRYSTNNGFYYTNGNTTKYLVYSNNSWSASTSGSKSYPYSVTTTTTEPVDATTITITGVAEGETSVTVGNTLYNITVEKQKKSVSLAVDGSVTYADSGRTVSVANQNVATASLSGGQLTINGVGVGTTTVTTETTVYTVTVKDTPDYVDLNSTPFTSGTGEYSGQKVTKLTTSVNKSYDLNISGSGNVVWSSADTNVATVDQNGTITGIGAGETTVTATVNGVAYTIPVVVVSDSYGGNYDYTCDIRISEISNTTVRYSLNLSTTFLDAQEGEAIYLGYSYPFCINFFGMEDDGYALTYMSSTNSAGNYYSLYQVDALSELAAYNGGAIKNQYQSTGFDSSDVDIMLRQAINDGYRGTMGWTRTTNYTGNSIYSDLSFRSQKLPTVEKTIKTVDDQPYTEGMTANVGAEIVYEVTVTQYATTEAITYSNVTLTDNLSGATFSTNSSNTVKPNLNSSTLTTDQTYKYEVTYTIKNSDLDTTINNIVDLSYDYTGQYSEGNYDSSAKAEAKITATSFDPEDVVIDFGLPVEFDFSMDMTERNLSIESVGFADGHVGGTVTVKNNVVTFTPDERFLTDEHAVVQMTNDKGGTYTFSITPASNVLYEDTFLSVSSTIGTNGAAWIQEGTAATTPQSPAQDTLYGYDDAYSTRTGNSMGSAWTISGLTSGNGSQYLTTTFYGTGFDLIGTAGPDTGYVYLLVQGPENKLIIIDTSYVGDGTTLYQVPLAHLELTEGEYTVYIRAAYRAATAGTASASTASAISTYSLYSAPSAADDIYAVLDELFMDGFEIDDVEFVYSDENSALAELAAPSMATFALTGDDGLDAQDAGDATAAASRPEGTTVTIDGFRVYRSSDNSAYSASEQGVTYVNVLKAVNAGDVTYYAYVEGADGTEFDAATYESLGGPQNEIYLGTDSNDAIAFKVNPGATVQISARAVTGSATLKVNGKEVAITSNTEMYYEVTPDENGIITVTNTGTGILGLGNLKISNEAGIQTLSLEDEPVVFSLLRMSAAPAEPEEPEEPEVPVFTPGQLDVKVRSTNVIFNKLVTVTITASADVAELRVNGKVLQPTNSLLVKWGLSKTYTYVLTETVKRSDTKAYEIVAYDAGGVASEAYTVQG